MINPDALPAAQLRVVSPDYFQAMRIPIRFGRTFVERDLKDPVVIINDTMARRFWPGRDPVSPEKQQAWLDWLCEQDDDPSDAPQEYWDPEECAPPPGQDELTAAELAEVREAAADEMLALEAASSGRRERCCGNLITNTSCSVPFQSFGRTLG